MFLLALLCTLLTAAFPLYAAAIIGTLVSVANRLADNGRTALGAGWVALAALLVMAISWGLVLLNVYTYTHWALTAWPFAAWFVALLITTQKELSR